MNVIKIEAKNSSVTHMKEKKSNMDILTGKPRQRYKTPTYGSLDLGLYILFYVCVFLCSVILLFLFDSFSLPLSLFPSLTPFLYASALPSLFLRYLSLMEFQFPVMSHRRSIWIADTMWCFDTWLSQGIPPPLMQKKLSEHEVDIFTYSSCTDVSLKTIPYYDDTFFVTFSF